ncbi:unnamed protein product [Larinioides sclopetarius]|uniref:Uncharacterized protein n=1 Tax=Larinioides sclopetarius TaxID=280406 RepID=A0AAV1YW42_9ARAC
MVISQSLTLISFIHSEIAISRVEQRCHQTLIHLNYIII